MMNGPYCYECKHKSTNVSDCHRPVMPLKPRDLVYGNVPTIHRSCSVERSNFLGWFVNRCGPEGKYYEKFERPPPPTGLPPNLDQKSGVRKPTPPPIRQMKQGFGTLIETKESKQAMEDWRKSNE